MYKLILTAPLLFFMFSCNNNSTSPQKNTKAIAITKTIDLKEVEVNTTKSCKFTLENTGNFPLTIYKVKTSCGCTNAKWSERPIKPGKSTDLSVEFSDKYPGRFYKTITVIGNLDEPLELTITGQLIETKNITN